MSTESLKVTSNSLVGRFFYGDASREWQGHVDAEVAPGVYLVELRSWLDGFSSGQRLVRLDEMDAWTFYSDGDWWRNSVDDVRTRWKYERERGGDAEAANDE